MRPLKEKELGPFGELSTSNPGSEAPGVGPEAPNVSARGADDVDMGDEVPQRGVSDAESVGGDEIREPRRRNSPSDPTSREIEDHVLTSVQVFDRGVQLVSKGVVEPRDTKGKAAKSWKMVRRSQSCRGIIVSLEPETESAEVERRGDSPVLVMHDGVTKSIFAHLIPAKGVDFPSCEKVVKMIVQDLDTLG